MDADTFEERLGELIAEAQADGVTTDEIISAMELRNMALQEESDDDGE